MFCVGSRDVIEGIRLTLRRISPAAAEKATPGVGQDRRNEPYRGKRAPLMSVARSGRLTAPRSSLAENAGDLWLETPTIRPKAIAARYCRFQVMNTHSNSE